MKLKVLQSFIDKFNGKTIYSPSQIIEIEDKNRCEDLISRGLCEAIEEVEAEPKAEAKTESEAETEAKEPKVDTSKVKSKAKK